MLRIGTSHGTDCPNIGGAIPAWAAKVGGRLPPLAERIRLPERGDRGTRKALFQSLLREGFTLQEAGSLLAGGEISGFSVEVGTEMNFHRASYPEGCWCEGADRTWSGKASCHARWEDAGCDCTPKACRHSEGDCMAPDFSPAEFYLWGNGRVILL